MTLSLDVRVDTVELVQIDMANLRRLAASEPVDFGAMTVCEGALPPAHVASRSLAQREAGTPALWCLPFLVLSGSRAAVLGGCTFKGEPVDGTVEIGYGVAERLRGRGIAVAAVRQLLQIAVGSGIVREVVAHIVPDNTASTTVVSRLGFSAQGSLLEPDGETVVRWTWRVAT